MQVEQQVRGTSPLSKKVALFNTYAQQHIDKQAINPFSQDNVGDMGRRRFSKEEYGKPEKGSKSEYRALVASLEVHKEMFELCKVIDRCGERLFTKKEKPDDPRKVISFGELFNIYTTISDKLVGMLLRARKHKLVEFEGEVLFQRRDDHVPIILMRGIEDISNVFNSKITEIEAGMEKARELHESHKHNSDSD